MQVSFNHSNHSLCTVLENVNTESLFEERIMISSSYSVTQIRLCLRLEYVLL